LKKMMKLNELNSFYLVGGTALSLYYGHRKSLDLDLFSIKDFSNEIILQALEKDLGELQYLNPNNPVGLFTFPINRSTNFGRWNKIIWNV